MDCSDNNRCFICRKCGKMMTVANKERGMFKCARCKNTTNVSEVSKIYVPFLFDLFPTIFLLNMVLFSDFQIRVPFAAKLLIQEIEAMSISTKFITA